MCGIAGLISGRQVDDALVRSMASRIAHRGPDGAGVWIDPEAGVGLGHRRLAIVDAQTGSIYLADLSRVLLDERR